VPNIERLTGQDLGMRFIIFGQLKRRVLGGPKNKTKGGIYHD